MNRYSKLSDAELTDLLKLDDRTALSEIYERYKRLLFLHAYKKLGNQQEAEDIIHEIFTSLWSRRLTLNFTGHLAGYLYTAVRNQVLDHYCQQKKESVYIQSLQKFIDEGEAITDHLVRENEMKALIDREVNLLPKKMREVFTLSRMADLSHREIAEKLDISEQTVRKHVQHALKVLRVKLGVYVIVYLLMNT
jgi:RNA polymerase sigma-70 factor (family 1)